MDMLIGISLPISVLLLVLFPLRFSQLMAASLVKLHLSPATAMLPANGQAAPVAFVAGIAGPLIGADFLHLKDISRLATGVASIGGAGIFDGIVLSGIVAAYLA
jgi:uncharacterized membrane protein